FALIEQAVLGTTGAERAAEEILAVVGARLGVEAAVVPDQAGVLVDFGLGILGNVDAPQVADALVVLGVLARADVEPVLVDDRRRDKVAARALFAQNIDRVLGVAVELPDQL